MAADRCDDTEPSRLKMDEDENGDLGGTFHFKKLPDGYTEETKVIGNFAELL